MCEAAYVVEVKRVGVACVVDVGDVILGKLRRLPQVVHGIGVRQSGWQVLGFPGGLQSEVQFGGAQFHVILPHVLGIAVKGRDGQQAITARARTDRGRRVWIRSIRERKNVLGILEALIRQRRVRGRG